MSPPLVVVMGVSGVGKSVVGQAIAARAGLEYSDGDDHHPTSNVASMAAGRPLTDEDRQPWLELVGGWLADHDCSGGVISCSALRRIHRDVLVRPLHAAVTAGVAGSDPRAARTRRARVHLRHHPGPGTDRRGLPRLGPDESLMAEVEQARTLAKC